MSFSGGSKNVFYSPHDVGLARVVCEYEGQYLFLDQRLLSSPQAFFTNVYGQRHPGWHVGEITFLLFAYKSSLSPTWKASLVRFAHYRLIGGGVLRLLFQDHTMYRLGIFAYLKPVLPMGST